MASYLANPGARAPARDPRRMVNQTLAAQPADGLPYPGWNTMGTGGVPSSGMSPQPLGGSLANPGGAAPQFTDRAPTATPYGEFVAPDPTAVANDPYYQFRLAEGIKARQKSAAARGTLLTGGTLKALEDYSQGLASEEGGKAFNRALDVYGTNRATNAQNFGQQMDTFGGNLGAFGANTQATLGAGNLALNQGRFAADTAFDVYDRGGLSSIPGLEQPISNQIDPQAYQRQLDDNFARQVEAARAQNAAPRPLPPQPPKRGTVLGRPR